MPQSILITGGTGKFGRQFVRHFVNAGWQVTYTTTSLRRAEALYMDYPELQTAYALELDLLAHDAATSLLSLLRERDIRVNHLVNNARSLNSLKVDERGQSARQDMLDEYLLGVVVPYELATALLNSQPDELQTVTNIGSQYGVVAANPNLYGDRHAHSPIHYGVAKAALHHLTRELAVRMAPDDVRVNAIAYGGVEGRTDSQFRTRYSELSPNSRMLKDAEVIGPLDFLTSGASTAVTGHVLVADGGWTVW